jgi:hypothetical protein
MLGGKNKITGGGERCRCFVIPFSISFSILGIFDSFVSPRNSIKNPNIRPLQA